MDRRRFIPSSEGLEVRTMLSTATAGGVGTASAVVAPSTSQVLPITFQQKQQRINNIPKNLRDLEPNRFLPKETVEQIQSGLNQIMGTMTPPPSRALTNYNLLMRDIAFNSSFSAQNANRLSHAFEAVLRSGNAPEEAVTTLVTAMDELMTQVDTASIRPNFLATNDNAYILQLAIVIGQQMPSPRIPTIAQSSGQQTNPRVAVTPLSNPTFTGSYEYNTTIQMIDTATNQIIGTAVVSQNNNYTLKVTKPLAVGKYNLTVVAVDSSGRVSHPSRTFGLQVTEPRHT